MAIRTYGEGGVKELIIICPLLQCAMHVQSEFSYNAKGYFSIFYTLLKCAQSLSNNCQKNCCIIKFNLFRRHFKLIGDHTKLFFACMTFY